MFQLDRSRKRRHLESSTTSTTNADRPSKGPLRGVVVCLTGLSPDEKERYHQVIEKLGGQYTRDLNCSHNTHLVAREAEGAKYEAAVASNIQIVRPSWLEACITINNRANESEHRLKEPLVCKNDTSNRVSSLPEAIDQQLQQNSTKDDNWLLFSACHFYLVGFDDEDKGSNDVLVNNLSRLIRRGLGTIYWEFHDVVTHVIVNDQADPSIREAAQSIRLQHNCTAFVSPWWVLDSWKSGTLQEVNEFPPLYRLDKKEKLPDPQETAKTSNRSSSSLFRGCVFALLRVSPPSWAVDFDSNDLEKSIRAHGGQMLSLKLLEALKIDGATIKTSQEAKRKCYVVCWGGYTSAHLEIHPLLAQVKRHALCDLLEVTPIWLQTCFSEHKIISPSRLPIIFVPGSRPIRSLSKIDGATKTTSTKVATIRLSITGFSGSKRTAIIHLIEAMGLAYDNSMRTSTTHLICREANGPKYEKAVEWKLRIVSIDWLYHIAQHGYSGENGPDGTGCESRFAVIDSSAD